MMFADRLQAARLLAEKLDAYKSHKNVLVVGLPRGGVPMARIVGDALQAPVDVLLVRKLGVPVQPELAFGAIAEGDVRVLDDAIIEMCGVTPTQIERAVEREQKEIARRALLFRGALQPPVIEGREVIIVDDGLATGSTMTAAIKAARARHARRIVVAVPVGSAEACNRVRKLADELVCLSIPRDFEAVGQHYRDFAQVTDEEAKAALAAPAVRR